MEYTLTCLVRKSCTESCQYGVDEKLKKTQEKDLPSHRKENAIVASILLIMICIIVGTIVNFYNKWSERKLVRKWNMSLPCDDLSLSVIEDLRMGNNVIAFSTDKFGNHICEFDNITYIVDKVAERIYRRRMAAGQGHTQFISCGNKAFSPNQSLYMAYFTRVENVTGPGYNKVVEWKQERNTSFVGKSFEYNRGFLRVNTTSLFYVSLTLTVLNGIEMTENDIPMIVSVSKQSSYKSHVYPSRLLEIHHPPCKNDINGTTTVHIGSHVLVDKHDQVFVQISDESRLVRHSRGNTFGIFKLE